MAVADGVAVVWFPVSDMDRAVSFYQDTLGLKLEQREDQWAELTANKLRIGLNQAESAKGDGGGVLAFQPEDGLDAAVSELEGKVDVEVSEHPWGRIGAFRDPDGNALQLYEPPSS